MFNRHNLCYFFLSILDIVEEYSKECELEALWKCFHRINMENSNAAVSSGGTTASVPESSLSWCLLQLQRTENPTKATAGGGQGKGQERKEDARKARAGLWRALVAIRTQHIKGGISSIIRFRARSGLPLLLKLLQQSACDRKTLDLTLSILANCCTESETRTEVSHPLRKREYVFGDNGWFGGSRYCF